MKIHSGRGNKGKAKRQHKDKHKATEMKHYFVNSIVGNVKEKEHAMVKHRKG